MKKRLNLSKCRKCNLHPSDHSIRKGDANHPFEMSENYDK